MKKLPASKLAEQYEFDSELEYYDYIIESERNGQHSQVKKLFAQMEEHSQMNCMAYFFDCEAYDLIKYLTYYLIQNQ